MAIQPIKVAITTGDPDGIGTEIAAKALAKLGPRPGVHFYLWRTRRCPRRHLAIIDSSFRRKTVSTLHEALASPPSSSKELIDIDSNLPPAKWVELSAKSSLYGHFDALATAPLSKSSIVASGMKALGHTEILKKVTKSPFLFMAFLGEQFNVLLATGHIPLSDVPKHMTADVLENAIRSAHLLKEILPNKVAKRPLALVGLNPHAGEEGLIGKAEEDVFKSVITNIKKAKIQIEGPLVPDVAFNTEQWKKYSVYICPYHDQGLIPFKMIHGTGNGVHLTMGLPFIRTSVDHGTAKDIFGRNKANPESMYLALNWAIKLVKEKRSKDLSIKHTKKGPQL